jgi:hypothetical protein
MRGGCFQTIQLLSEEQKGDSFVMVGRDMAVVGGRPASNDVQRWVWLLSVRREQVAAIQG